MAKIVPSKKLGVPVPPVVGDIVSLVLYYDVAGESADYIQSEREEFPISELEIVEKVVGDVPTSFYVVDTSVLPPLPEGEYDIRFTFEDDVGNESDFSPAYTLPLDREAPTAPGQPIALD